MLPERSHSHIVMWQMRVVGVRELEMVGKEESSGRENQRKNS